MASIDKVKNKIEETQKLLKEEEKAFSEGSDFLVEKRKEHQKLNKEKQQLQADLEMKEAEFNTAAQAIQKTAVAQSHHQQNIDLYKLDIKTQTRELQILELLEKQPPFWDLAEERLTLLMKDLNSGLEGFEDNVKDPKDVCRILREERANPRSFTNRTVQTSQTLQFYETSLRKLCEMRVDGKKIPPSEKQARLNIIDRYFHHGDVVGLWS